MIHDPVLSEIRAYRDQLSMQLGQDPKAFRAWLKSREEESRRSGRRIVTRAPKRVQPASGASR